jgi:nucleoid-associated protein YgaU
VGRGDTYWSLAERCFGDGARWSEIRDLNVGRVVADGVTMGADDDLRRGWTILLPDIPNKEVV